jgi:hypothetical protein
VLEGEVPQVVRDYRDSHYPKGGIVSNGYGWMSTWFVPLMKEHPKLKEFIRYFTSIPLIKYAEWYYGKNKTGWKYAPIKWFWITTWRIGGFVIKMLGYEAYPDWRKGIAVMTGRN